MISSKSINETVVKIYDRFGDWLEENYIDKIYDKYLFIGDDDADDDVKYYTADNFAKSFAKHIPNCCVNASGKEYSLQNKINGDINVEGANVDLKQSSFKYADSVGCIGVSSILASPFDMLFACFSANGKYAVLANRYALLYLIESEEVLQGKDYIPGNMLLKIAKENRLSLNDIENRFYFRYIEFGGKKNDCKN